MQSLTMQITLAVSTIALILKEWPVYSKEDSGQLWICVDKARFCE